MYFLLKDKKFLFFCIFLFYICDMQTLIVIDKQAISNAGIHYLAGKTGELVTVTDARTTKELATLLEGHPTAVVVMDFSLLDLSSDYLLIMHERFKQVQWILFSEQLSNDFIRRMAFYSKAFSIVMKDATQEAILDALVKGMHHEQYLSSRAEECLKKQEEMESSPLTSTEKDILRWIAMGRSAKEIAEIRHSSVHTITTHRKNIFRKIQVNNAYEATRYALRAGIANAAEYYI